MKLSTVATRLLSDRTYDIEFSGYLSNHAKHAIVALEGLQAKPERVQEYWDQYTHLTPYNLPLHRADWDGAGATSAPCTAALWNDWRGKKIHWPEQVLFLNSELEERFDGDTSKLVKEYATPELLEGMTGALTHGIIHLGWGIDAGSPWMITEGLAYLNFCHIGVDNSKLQVDTPDFSDETCLWDSLARVALTFEKENLAVEWVEATKALHGEDFHPELVPAGFQWQVAKIVEDAHPVVTRLPGWLETTPLDDLWELLYKDVVRLYLATRSDSGNGVFLILHAITSLWALEHTLKVIGEESVARHALRHYYTMVISLLATSGFPSSKVLQQGSPTAYATDKAGMNWDPIFQAGIAETEEHNIKLVYVARELWRRYGRWGGFSEAAKSFTLTPNIGPSSVAFSASS